MIGLPTLTAKRHDLSVLARNAETQSLLTRNRKVALAVIYCAKFGKITGKWRSLPGYCQTGPDRQNRQNGDRDQEFDKGKPPISLIAGRYGGGYFSVHEPISRSAPVPPATPSAP